MTLVGMAGLQIIPVTNHRNSVIYGGRLQALRRRSDQHPNAAPRTWFPSSAGDLIPVAFLVLYIDPFC